MPRAFLVRKGPVTCPRRSPQPTDEIKDTKRSPECLKRDLHDDRNPILGEITSLQNVLKTTTRKSGLHQPFLPDVESDTPLVAQTPSSVAIPSGGQCDPTKPLNRSPAGSPSEPPRESWLWWKQTIAGLTPAVYPSLSQHGYPYGPFTNAVRDEEYYYNLREHIMNTTNYRESMGYDNIHSGYRYPHHVIPYQYSTAQTAQTYKLMQSSLTQADNDSAAIPQNSPKSSLFPWSLDNNTHGNDSDSPKSLADSTTHHVDKKRKRDAEVAPRYQCDDCNKSYSTVSGLSKHKQFHCSNQLQKQFACKYCNKAYVSLGALKMHIRTHTLPCKCNICGKAFSRPWLLQGHIRTHTGERPFNCSHCGRAFADRSNLRAHLQTHSDVKKYSCTACSKTFSRMSLLLKHQDGGCVGAC